MAEKAERLAYAWFSDPAAKEEVTQLLKDFQLDETAIEAEAVRPLTDRLEQFDRLLASLESRRNKALRCIAEYRGGLARQLRESSDRIIDGKVLSLEHAPIRRRRPQPDRDQRKENRSEPSQCAKEHGSPLQRRQNTDEPQRLPSRSHGGRDVARKARRASRKISARDRRACHRCAHPSTHATPRKPNWTSRRSGGSESR